MSAQPYTEAEVGAWRAYVAACASGVEIPTHERAGIRALFRLSLPSDYYARWLATVDALQARLAAAEAVVDEARFVAKMRGDDYSCQVATTDVDAMIALEIRLSEYDAHLAPAPTKPEGGEVGQ